MRRRLLLWSAIALSAVGCWQPSAAPNVVVFLADDLGWNDVGYHGSEIPTPHIDTLAASGVRMERFYVSPVCSATRASLLTGRYPMRHGLQMGVIRPWATHGLPLGERTLPAALRDSGYRTALLGKWHLGMSTHAQLPNQRGFDHHYGHYTGAIDYFDHHLYGGLDWHRNGEPVVEPGYTTELLADEAERWLEEGDASQPFFLVLAFNAPHRPLQAPDSYIERVRGIADPERRVYAAMVSAMDDAIGRVLDRLDALELRDETLVWFISDNGAQPLDGGSNEPLRGGKALPYEGGVKVPAIAVWPGRLPEGRIVDAPLHAVDLFPTLLALANATAGTTSLTLDGRNIWPLLADEAQETDRADPEVSGSRPLLLELTAGRGAVLEEDWKLVVRGLDQPDEEMELYDLAADPAEAVDVAAEHAETAARLRAQLREWTEQAAPAKWVSETLPPKFPIPSVWGPAR